MINRSGSAPVPDEVEIIGGDAADSRFTIDVDPRSPGRLPDPQPALLALGGGIPSPASRRPRRRASPRGPACQHGERLHVWPPGWPATDRDPRLRRTHHERETPSQMATELLAAHQAGNVAVAIGRASDYFGPRGGAQSNLGDRAIPRRPGREDRQRPRRPRPATHLHLHPGHRRRPRRARRTSRRARPGMAPAQRPGHPHHPTTVRTCLPAGRRVTVPESVRYRPSSFASPH